MPVSQVEQKNPRNQSSGKTFRQLMVVKYNPDLGPNTFHLLVRSTAPTNAEDPALAAHSSQLTPLEDHSTAAIKRLQEHLNAYVSQHRVHLIKLALNIHGYSTPLLNFANNAYEVSDAKFSADIAQAAAERQGQAQRSDLETFKDFVIFVDFSWPSEHALSLPLLGTIRAMPAVLWVVLALALAAGVAGVGLVAGALLGLMGTMILLRQVTYFRDRDRAATYGVYDAVELVRWVQQMIKKAFADNHLTTDPPVELNVMAHSMGSFVATQMIRTLSDVFDAQAIQRLDPTLGPFAEVDPCAPAQSQQSSGPGSRGPGSIGGIFQLGQLVLASPDIPVWALSSGRSNALLASLRRFKEVFIFSNDADMVLRLASTMANFFVFPSKTQEGGYRLGNITDLNQDSNPDRSAGWSEGDFHRLGLHGLSSGPGQAKAMPLDEPPFNARLADSTNLRVIDCTNYRDRDSIFRLMKQKVRCADDLNVRKERLMTEMVTGRCQQEEDLKTEGTFACQATPRLAAARSSSGRNLWRYLSTMIQHFVTGKLDSHGGYFQGPFCLDLMYSLLLSGSEGFLGSREQINKAKLTCYGLSWIDVVPPDRQAQC